MRLAINILGLFILSIFFISLLFIIQHWPGAYMMLSAPFAVLIVGLIPLYFVNRIIKSSSTEERILSILGLVSMELLALALGTYLLKWANNGNLLIAAGLVFAITLFLYLKQETKKEDNDIQKTRISAAAGIFLSLFLILIGLNNKADLKHDFVYYQQQQQNSKELISNKIEKQVQTLQMVYGEDIFFIEKMKTATLYQIDSIKLNMILYADGGQFLKMANKNTAPTDYSIISAWDNIDVAGYCFLNQNYGGLGMGTKLKNMIEDYNVSIQESIDSKNLENKELYVEKVKHLLTLESPVSFYGDKISWEASMSEMRLLIASLNSLTLLELKVLLAQASYNQYIIDNLKK